jgi:hypothetical protein
MGIKDGINAALAPALSWKQARSLQKQAERKAKNDALVQHDYERARHAMLGDFAAAPADGVRRCAANAKVARRQERLDLVGRGVVACPEHAEEAGRLRKDMDEVENMRCARHVYQQGDEGLGDAPPGFRPATTEELAQMGLKPEDLQQEGSHFKAAVYMKEPAVWGDHPSPAAVLAFRGSTPAKEDWDNNFAQNANADAPYYAKAVSIGNKLAMSGADVQLAGHSLGGGLASAAQGASGLPCSTYNAAGLHPATVAHYLQDQEPLGDPAKIQAYRIQGEVLTQTQESGLLSVMAHPAAGTKHDLAPPVSREEFKREKAAGVIDKDDGYADYLHGMDGVIESMEQQKAADQATLQACLANQA